MSLEAVFSDEPQEEVQEEIQSEAQEVEQKVEEGKPDQEAKEEKESETTPEKTEDDDKQDWTLAAVKDERRKRQELEKKLADLEAKQQKPEKHPDVFDDQEAFVSSLRSEFQQELGNAKLEIARSMMMEHKEDYEEMEAKFIEIAQDNPTLRDQAAKHQNPAKFAYEQAKKYEQYKEVQNVDKYKEKIRSELRKEIEAELKGSISNKAKKAQNLEPSLASARASDKSENVETTLEDLFSS